MMAKTRRAMMPDISIPRMYVEFVLKYAIKPTAVIRKVSVTTECDKNLIYLKNRHVRKPSAAPIPIETSAMTKNWQRILRGV